jgi:TPR repeat protein
MKRFLASERARAGSLIVAAALIGGTGCVTAMVVGNLQQQARASKYREEQQEKLQRDNAELRAKAERGEVEAMARLGWFQVNGDRSGVPADPHGLALLEQAAARHYAPAEYMLGVVLVEGRKGIPADPARGVELLKLSATKACSVEIGRDLLQRANPNLTLGNLYRKGSPAVAADESEAELWFARNAVYCHDYGFNPMIPAGLAEPERRARMQAWWTLSGRTYAMGNQPATPEQIQETERELKRLRQRVQESESRYPAPPKPQS